MSSASSPSSTENSTILPESLKDRAISLLKEEKIDEKEITAFSQELMMLPNLDDDIVAITTPLLGIDSFEIFKEDKVNPVFIRYLLNLIHIINFIWLVSKNNIEVFHKSLLNLGIMFSYIYRNEKDDKDGIDYALLAQIPNSIYDFISKNGKNSFKDPNAFNFEEEIFNADKNEVQVGYVYQENVIASLLSNLDPKVITICPNIMFYLEYECSKKLFNTNIFNSPANYLNLVHKEDSQKSFHGYNEIDLSFTLSEPAKIKENFTFNVVKKKNEDLISKGYIPTNDSIIFESNSNIFIEIKSSLKKQKMDDVMERLKNMCERFSLGYNNSAYANLEKKFSQNTHSSFLFYDDNRIDLFNKIDKDLKIDKDVEICYNSAYVQISSIVSLQNQIREIKKEENLQKEKINQLQELVINEREINRKEREINKYKLSIMNIKLMNLKEKDLKQIIEMCIKNGSVSSFSSFKSRNSSFIEGFNCFEKVNKVEDIIAFNDKILDEQVINQDYVTLLSLLDKKINEKTFCKNYYIAYKDMLTGKIYKETNGKKCDFPSCGKDIANIIKNVLKFIYLLDTDPMILNCFFAAILYYTIDIVQQSKNYENLYLSKFKDDDMEGNIIYVIKSLNPSFKTEFLEKDAKSKK